MNESLLFLRLYNSKFVKREITFRLVIKCNKCELGNLFVIVLFINISLLFLIQIYKIRNVGFFCWPTLERLSYNVQDKN